jgi:hypothetical protein
MSSTSEVEVREKPTSYSDEAEWAREQGLDSVDPGELERLSQDMIGLPGY